MLFCFEGMKKKRGTIRERMISILRLFAVIFLALAAVSAGTQIQPGDLIVGDLGYTPGVYAVRDTGVLVATLLLTYPDYPNALDTWGGAPASSTGQDIAVSMIGVPDRFLRLTPGGVVTTIKTFTRLRPNGLDLDPDGTWVISASGEDGLHRLDPGNSVLSTIWTNNLGGHVNSIAINQDTGRYAVALFARTGPRVVEVDRSGTLVATLDKTISDISSIEWDLSTSTYTVTDFLNLDPAEFVRLDPVSSKVTSLIAPISSHALNAHARTRRGTWWLAGGRISSTGRLHEVTAGGVFLKTFTLPVLGAAPTSILIHGERSLSTSGKAAPGSTFHFHLSTRRPADRGKVFILTLSRASHPPVQLSDGRRIDLHFDFLAFNVLLGNLAPFLGGGSNIANLDGNGNASARLTLPTYFPSGTGLRLFAAFAVLDASTPTGFGTLSNTVGFTLQ